MQQSEGLGAEPWIAVVGNPNVGKTSLFNRLTGQTARVGNYPGITVERREGLVELPGGRRARLLDVPGAYSLSARSADEQIAVDCALGLNDQPYPDLVIAVVDAGQLGRNLYLVCQLLEAALPMIVVLNMMDEIREDPPDVDALSRLLGVPCVGTDARHGVGLDALKRAIAEALIRPPKPAFSLNYPGELLADLATVIPALPEGWGGTEKRARALALWALTSIEPDDELRGIPAALRGAVNAVRNRAGERDLDLEIAQTRYAFIDALVPKLHTDLRPHPPKRKTSERVDRILLHPVFGLAIFAGVMVVVFQSLFAWSDPLIQLIEAGVSALQQGVQAVTPPGIAQDFICEGLLGGVGNVVVFLPQILLLFLFVGLLEDSGYMARVAFLMDRVMRALGLHGRAFVPLLSGYACAVPAILATRTMERQRDRLLTMLVIPLMTCSARLPVYTLIIGALFPPSKVFGWVPVQGLLLVALYLFSMVAALVVAGVLGRTVVKGRRIPLILELPPYRLPSLAVTLRSLGERAATFLKEAGTVILAITVVLWFLLSFPRPDLATAAANSQHTPHVELMAAPGTAAPPRVPPSHPQIEDSYGGRAGKWLEPWVKPLGFDWKIGVGLVGAFAAREVFVSTMALVYGIGDTGDDDTPLRDRMRAETRPDGLPAYSPLVGLSLLVFFALACQCMSTLAVVGRESKSWRWPAFVFGYTLALAWGCSFLVYQGGRLLGFG